MGNDSHEAVRRARAAFAQAPPDTAAEEEARMRYYAALAQHGPSRRGGA